MKPQQIKGVAEKYVDFRGGEGAKAEARHTADSSDSGPRQRLDSCSNL